jgi:hypothetical protein
MFTSRVLWLSMLLTCVGCAYDFNELYMIPDGGVGDGDGGDAALRSSHLIGLWGNYPTVDDECIQCAETACADVEAACRADPECVTFTRCVAETPTPAGLMACRTRHLAWVTSENFVERDLNGPYGQCVFRDACSRECEGASDSACFQNYAWPTTSDMTVPFHLILNDSENLEHPLPGVTAKVCPEGDPLCKMPAGTGVTNERGYVKLDLPTSFNRAFTGFIELQGSGLYPQLIKFSWNIGGPSTQVVTMINKVTWDFFSTNYLQLPIDPTRGMQQTRMFGCSGLGIRGMRFSTTGGDAQTIPWYFDNGLPSVHATETGNIGAGGAFNVQTGYQTITATRASDGLVVAHTNAPIRAGFMTVVILEPEAHQ